MRDRVMAGRLVTSKSNVLLLGPRQVGKSTICRHLRAQVYVDLADEAEFLGYAKDPARLRRVVDALPPGSATLTVGGYGRSRGEAALPRGRWMTYSTLSGGVELPKETARRSVQLLDATLLAHRLPPFRPSRSTSRRLVQRERVLLFDVGVRNALLGLHRRPLGPDQMGALFEQWTMLQIIYLNHALRRGWKLSTYRTEAGAAVDLVVERARDLVAIEIKAARQVTPAGTKGLLSLAGLVGRRRPIALWLAFRGERAQRFDSGVEALPVLEALRRLAAE